MHMNVADCLGLVTNQIPTNIKPHTHDESRQLVQNEFTTIFKFTLL